MINTAEFRFNSGRLSLDLPATLRRRASEPHDVLTTPGAPARWLRDAGLCGELLDLSEAEERDLLSLREAVWASADAARSNRPLPSPSVEVINKAAAHQLAIPQLDASTASLRIIADDPFHTALAKIARDAIELIAGPLMSRIKACAQDDCGMLFVDTSPSARRRWCSMDRCGSRAKGKAFRHRHKGGADE